MKIAAMMRVRNESRWIGRGLASLRPICNAGLFVFDDRSTDDTAKIARSFGATVLADPFDGLNEVRDKNFLVQQVFKTSKADWIVHLDGDEVLEAAGAKELPAILRAAPPHIGGYALPVIYLWNSERLMRVDGVYSRLARPSVFRTSGSNLTFKSFTAAKSGFHCGNVPFDQHPRCGSCSVRIKHFGYLERNMRLDKYAFYTKNDPHNEIEDNYRHIVQGDVTEVPAGARLKHAGPLTLAPYLEQGVT